MWTTWRTASRVEEINQGQISYTDGSGPLDATTNIITVRPARGNYSTRGLVTEEPNGLIFSNFGFDVSGSVIGVELRLETQRLSRIQDRTIQLHYNGLLGQNQARDLAEDSQVYGSADSLWGIESFDQWSSADFGVVIDLQPNIYIPSNNPVIIRSVSLRLNLA